jgi:hypothetical protein
LCLCLFVHDPALVHLRQQQCTSFAEYAHGLTIISVKYNTSTCILVLWHTLIIFGDCKKGGVRVV